jgi:hypothetical protein
MNIIKQNTFDFDSLAESEKDKEADIAVIAMWLENNNKQKNLPDTPQNPINRWKSENLLFRKIV